MQADTPDILKEILNYKAEYVAQVKRIGLITRAETARAADCEAPVRGFTNNLT